VHSRLDTPLRQIIEGRWRLIEVISSFDAVYSATLGRTSS
jgi:hypothetical protein